MQSRLMPSRSMKSGLLPEVLVVVAQVGAVEVVEDGQAGGAEEARAAVVADVLLPLVGAVDGVEQLGEVLHLLLVLAYARGHVVVLVVRFLVVEV